MHRWELEARSLVKKLQFKDLTEQELQLWNHLRMCLDELDRIRQATDKDTHTSIGGGDTYGDGY